MRTELGRRMPREVQQSMRAAGFACLTGCVTVFQVVAFAQVWAWQAQRMNWPSMGIGAAMALGVLVAMLPDLIGSRRAFSWGWTVARLSKSLLLLAIGYVATHHFPGNAWGGDWPQGLATWLHGLTTR